MSIETETPDAMVQRIGDARRYQAKAFARLLAAPFQWMGRHRRAQVRGAALSQLSPEVLADVGLRRVGDIVVGAETPDCANNNCADAFTDRRAA